MQVAYTFYKYMHMKTCECACAHTGIHTSIKLLCS